MLMTIRRLGFSICLCVFLVKAGNAASEKVEIENQWVRVLRVTQAPHEKSPMHEHPASVVVYLTDLHQKITRADGKTHDLKKKAREVAYFDATKQADESVSNKPIEAIIVELKPGAPKAVGWPVKLDPVKLDAKHHPFRLRMTAFACFIRSSTRMLKVHSTNTRPMSSSI